MARLGGLQLSKPISEWESWDKLTELEQFKADCRILFDGPLSDLKDKQRGGLLVNWLGWQATQIFACVDVEINNTNEVFKALERILGQNQTKPWPGLSFITWNRNAHRPVMPTYQSSG